MLILASPHHEKGKFSTSNQSPVHTLDSYLSVSWGKIEYPPAPLKLRPYGAS